MSVASRSRFKLFLGFSAALLSAGPPLQAASPRDAAPATDADAALNARVRSIVEGMTLEQKVGQITQADIRSITPEDVRKYYIGSVLNGGGAWPAMNMHSSVDDWLKLSDEFYRASMSTDMKVKVPVIWGVDAVHGHNNIYGATLFPHNIGLGAARDPKLMYRIGRATAEQVRATGLTWTFAPTLAVVQNPRWGRTYESYSSDPALVRAYAGEMVRGLQGQLGSPTSVLATAKHWIGDGGTFHGKDQGETRTSEANLMRTHGAGYYGAIGAGVQTVMISYSSFTDTGTGKQWGKMHGNAHLIDEVLKKRLGFKGLVVSDWNGMEQVPGCTKSHCPQAINAGIDLAMVPEEWKQFIPATIEDIRAGRIPMSRIDDAVVPDHPRQAEIGPVRRLAGDRHAPRCKRAQFPRGARPRPRSGAQVAGAAQERPRGPAASTHGQGPARRARRGQPADAIGGLVAHLAGRQDDDRRLSQCRHIARGDAQGAWSGPRRL